MIGTGLGQARFLVSVRSPQEASIALSGGADIIDLKEPREGALGAVPLAVAETVVRVVAGRQPVSATIGDCPLHEASERATEMAGTGVDYVKIGLFGEASGASLRELQRCAASGICLIGVMFADRAPEWAVLSRLSEAGFRGVMLDTVDKAQGGLCSHLNAIQLREFLAAARAHGLLAGLAGSLRESDARALLPLRPDVLGFRGALCASGRRGHQLESQRVAMMRALISRERGTEQAAGRVVMAEEG
jgi:(5-formylfuran-3-yl)methyl phosphate synthase